MTSLSENEQKNEINIDSKQCASENEQSPLHNTTIIQETSHNDQEVDEKEQSNDLVHETEENKITNDINNDNALMNPSPPIVTPDEEQQQQENEATESTVNHDEDDKRSKKSFHSNVKFSSIPYRRTPYYLNEHPYGSASYYYYTQPSIDKPTPLMFVSTQQSSSTSRDNQTGNTTTVSPQNLPPRLRQTSTTENESNSQASSTTPTTTSQSSTTATTTTTTTTATNGRRHRSILPRGTNNYYSPHPPPLMATPPGVLYTYPPAVHQPGHIAYNIRTPDELELLAFQQQFMNLPPPSIIWPPTALPPHGHPHFPGYPMNGLPPPSAYMFNNNNSTVAPSANSFLNPEAAEWVPPLRNDSDSSSDNQILIDDEINFPPLNSTITNTQIISTNIKDSIEDKSEQIDNSSETVLTNNTNDNPPISTDNSNISSQANLNIESTNISSSSQDDNTNKPLSSSPIKITPITYSTIISQTSENNKSNKNNQQQNRPQQQQQQQPTNNIHNQLPPRDRINKPQQRIQNTSSSSSNLNSRRRQPFNNNRNMTRNLLTSETNSLPKQQQQPSSSPPISDDWIEVKSKKTKKFDRNINDNFSEKIILDEQIPKSLSPPLSLTSTGDNTTTTTFTSEDDFDEKDNNDLVIIMNNNLSNDYNQIIIDDIHRKLDNNEKLLIIMRGCPGSGKSTLAKSINQGYNGVILSADDHFTDNNLNTYTFDPSRLDDAHRSNRRQASDAFKRNISPIIIDNTNTQAWEMKPYVAMGKESGYDIHIVEPQTPWRYKARELSKRNGHDVPLRRIKDMLSRFEHNITVQSLLDKIPSIPKTNNIISNKQENLVKDQEILDPILTSKKFYDIIDDSLILDDVRLCINDMILFLTSNFFQTTTSPTSQSSTSLSVSFHDLSLISSSASSSLPSTPSTPHSRFHRPITRFPSTTNQDHTFNTEHILRLPTTAFSRCIDSTPLTPTLSTQSNNIGKKRRKNKTKQQTNEILLNINNNNNNMNDEQETCQQQQQQVFNVILPEDCSDFIVIDEQNDNDWIDTVNKNFGIQMNSFR